MKREIAIAILLSDTEKRALDYVASDLGFSTPQFARLLFAVAVADVEDIAKRIRSLQQKARRSEARRA
jgi:hypothetical protein